MTSTLILGGARSGKSCRAEALAKCSGLPVTYIATAPHIAADLDWQQRIRRHREERPTIWKTREEPLAVAALLCAEPEPRQCFLIDCLTLWLSNVMYAKRDIEHELQCLCKAMALSQHDLIVVSNELGMGLIPERKLGRDFRDAQGFLNQQVAQVVDHVEFVVAGLPLTLK